MRKQHHSRQPNTVNSSNPLTRHLAFEALEDRRMLAINWTNQNTFNDADPNDNRFDNVFGTMAAQAIATVNGALDYWRRVIADFNYDGDNNPATNNTYNISISMNPTAAGFGANGGWTNPMGKPNTGFASIGQGTVTPNPNDSNGWFLDSTPLDSSEFQNGAINAFVSVASTAVGNDMLTTVLHEIGHALGIASATAVNALSTTDVNSNLWIDTINTPATTPVSRYYAFNGPSVKTLMTAYDSGGASGMPSNTMGAQHAAPAGASVVKDGITYFGATDLMNTAAGGFSNVRAVPSRNNVLMLKDAYGYTVVEPTTLGTMYNTLDANGTLRITTPGAGPDVVDLSVAGGSLFVNMTLGSPVAGADPPAIATLFPLAAISSISINTGGGSDRVKLLPISASIPISISLGSDPADVLEINGTAGYDSVTVNASSLISSGVNIVSMNGQDSIVLNTGLGDADLYLPTAFNPVTINAGDGGETIVLHSLGPSANAVINGNGGNDTIVVAPTGGFQSILGQLTINGGLDNDIIRLTPIDSAAYVIDTPIRVNGGEHNDTLYLTNGTLDAITGLVTFDGEGGSNKVVLNDQAHAASYGYDVTSSSVTLTRNPLFAGLNYSNVNDIEINAGLGANEFIINAGPGITVTANGNDGPDTFLVGGGNMVGYLPQNLDGGAGIDTITFDDHLNSANRIWDIGFNPNEIAYGGLISLTTTGFESVGILAGLGNDNLIFYNDLTQNFSANGGGGNDTVELNDVSNYRDFVTQNGDPAFSHTLNIDGGGGFNTLTLDDTTSPNRYYFLSDGHVALDEGVPLGLRFDYDSFQSMTIQGGDFGNEFYVSGTSSDIPLGQQTTLYGGTDVDTFLVYPHDSEGNVTFPSGLGMIGGGGIDSFYLDDSASLIGAEWVINNFFGAGTQSFGFGGTPFIGTLNDLENLYVRGSQGDDTYNIEEYRSGTALRILGNAGNDTVRLSPTAKNLPGTIIPIAFFSFDGGDGFYDTLEVHNDNSTNAWTYTRQPDYLTTAQPGYVAQWNQTNVENLVAHGGQAADSFLIQASPTVGSDAYLGAEGNDNYVLGSGGLTNLIRNYVSIINDADFDSVTIDDSADTVGRTAHIDEYFVGASVGDDLFGPGGYLNQVNLQGTLTLLAGTGEDTIYAQPLANATVSIAGNNPTTAPGDTLNLNLAAAQDYTVNGSSFNGNVTSTNLKTISYTGFETGPILASAEFDGDGDIDGHDFLAWQRGFGLPNAQKADGDANNDMFVDDIDLGVWQLQFGLAPPPLVAGESLKLSVESQEPELGSQLSSSELIDIALAVEWMKTVVMEDDFFIEFQHAEGEAARNAVIASGDIHPVSIPDALERKRLTAGSTGEYGGEENWLSNELLERVFG